MIENVSAGIVLTARSFNPSIFTEAWLVSNGILCSDDLVGTRVYSPEVAQFQIAQLQVLVIPPKLQITFGLRDSGESSRVSRQIAARIVELLPHTPYQALGLNFDYFVAQPAGEGYGAYNRSLLGTGDCPLLREFPAADARFGRYFSTDHGKSRLRLDVKPVKAGPEDKEFLQFSFNFHHDVSEVDVAARAKEVVAHIGTWESLRSYAEKLVNEGSVR